MSLTLEDSKETPKNARGQKKKPKQVANPEKEVKSLKTCFNNDILKAEQDKLKRMQES
jgi:hypothetical protein